MRNFEVSVVAVLVVLVGSSCPDFTNVPCAKDDNCPNGYVCGCERVCTPAAAGTQGCSFDDGGVRAGGSGGGPTAGGSTAGGSTAGGSTAGGSTAGGSVAGGSAAGGSVAGGSTAGGSTAGGSAAGGMSAGGAAGGGESTGGGGATGGSGGATGGSGGATGGSGGSTGGSGGSSGGGGVNAGDNCSSAIPLSFTGTTLVTGSLAGLLNDSTVCGGTGPDAVYRVSLSSPATLTAQVTTGAFTPRVSVRSACSSTSTLACDPSSSFGLASATTGPLDAGTYFVWVDSSLSAGAYSLRVTADRIDAGPGTVSSVNMTVGGQMTTFDQYVPRGGARFPAIALGHGFQLGKGSLATLATELRDDGFVVVVPQFTGSFSPNHVLNGQMLLAALDLAVDAGIADPANLAFGGHSAGGLAAWLAAAQRSSRAVVLLDPVDDTLGTGLSASMSVAAPTLWVLAPPTSCNSNNNGAAWYAMKPNRKARVNVVNAVHCDGTTPVPMACSVCSGASDPARALVFRRYARAHFGRELLGPTLYPCVEPMAFGDLDAGIVNNVVTMLGCP